MSRIISNGRVSELLCLKVMEKLCEKWRLLITFSIYQLKWMSIIEVDADEAIR